MGRSSVILGQKNVEYTHERQQQQLYRPNLLSSPSDGASAIRLQTALKGPTSKVIDEFREPGNSRYNYHNPRPDRMLRKKQNTNTPQLRLILDVHNQHLTTRDKYDEGKRHSACQNQVAAAGACTTAGATAT